MAAGGPWVIEGYTIVSGLGAGAFGKVFCATKNGNKYAIKKIAIGQPENVDKIMKEVNTHKKLSHENIIKYYDDFNFYNAVWIVMEYCNGGDLNSFMLSQSPGDKELIDLTQQLCDSVDYLHSQQVIHRDIKPDNIMICNRPGRWTLKLADFGLARVWGNFSNQSPFYGFNYDPRRPYYYSAPETANGNVTFKSDIFSLGCVILAMFSRTYVPWGSDKKLLAPYITIQTAFGVQVIQIADATESQKVAYINQYVNTPSGVNVGFLRYLVLYMVQENWQVQPEASVIYRYISSFNESLTRFLELRERHLSSIRYATRDRHACTLYI